MVVEVRASGMDKGNAVRNLQKQMHADAMVFVGDDLGDLEAFDAVADLRRRGMVGFLVCSGSDEQQALVEKADLVVDGPDGVVAFLHQLAGRRRQSRQLRRGSGCRTRCADRATRSLGLAHSSSRGAEGHGPSKPRQPATAVISRMTSSEESERPPDGRPGPSWSRCYIRPEAKDADRGR